MSPSFMARGGSRSETVSDSIQYAPRDEAASSLMSQGPGGLKKNDRVVLLVWFGDGLVSRPLAYLG